MIGVYIINNSIDSKCYVGSSIDIKDRWNRHKQDLLKNIHHSKPLQNFVNKYGIDTICFKLIENCGKKDLISREQHYIDTLNPYFNICKTAGNRLGSTVSEETRLKISNKLKGTKRIRTQEQIDKHRQAVIGRTAWNKGIKMGSIANPGKPILQLTIDGIIIKEWNHAKEIEQFTKINRRNIGQCCKGKRKTAGGFMWKYKLIT